MGLALVAIKKGYKMIVTMPDKMSVEKIDILKAMGVEVIITPTNVNPDDPNSYYSIAKKLQNEIENILSFKYLDGSLHEGDSIIMKPEQSGPVLK